MISYRHWNMMEEFIIVNQLKETLCFVPEDGRMEQMLQYAKTTPPGSRWFDRDYVLPDFVHTFTGTVLIPKARGTIQQEEMGEEHSQRTIPVQSQVSKQDETFKEDSSHGSDKSIDEDIESEDESEEAKRNRILQQKEEEKRLREAQLEEHQVLPMSVERFTVPEILFRPTDIGLNQLGLAEAIIQSIQACDPIFHAAMYHNIVLTGGNMLLPNLKRRLEVELRALVPCQYKIRIYLPEDPIVYAWEGAREWALSGTMYENACLDRSQWEEMRKTYKDWRSLWQNSGTKPISKPGYSIL
jgi:actin-related protein 6